MAESHRRRDADQRPFWGTGAPITCVHNVEILTRFTWMLAVHASHIPHSSLRRGDAAVKRERVQKEGRRRRKRYEERPHFTSPCLWRPRLRRALVESCHLSWNSRGQVAFEWVFFRVRVDALEFYRHFLLTVNKATCGGLALRAPQGTRNKLHLYRYDARFVLRWIFRSKDLLRVKTSVSHDNFTKNKVKGNY